MVSGATLGALAGFLAALVMIGIPLGKYLYDTRALAAKAVRLITGEEETDNDGVLPRLSSVEQRSRRIERALYDEDMLPRTDGGTQPQEGEA